MPGSSTRCSARSASGPTGSRIQPGPRLPTRPASAQRHPRSSDVKPQRKIEGGFPGGPRRWPRRRGCGSSGIPSGCRRGGWRACGARRCGVSFGALLVVEGACSGGCLQRRKRPGHQGVDEPVVVDEPGGDDLLLARGAGDRAGAAVVLAGLRADVAAGVVAELAGHPGAEDGCQAGLGLVDLSVRVPPKMLPHLLFADLDLGVQVVITAIRDRAVGRRRRSARPAGRGARRAARPGSRRPCPRCPG